MSSTEATSQRQPPAKTQPEQSPDYIKAIALRHPGEWVAATVIVGLLVLFLIGAATNSAYDWHTYWQYLFDKRVSQAAMITLLLTVLAMVCATVLGVALAVMRLSRNRVLKAVSWAFLWFFRGTPVYVQLVFWGLLAVIYKQIDIGIPYYHQFVHIQTGTFLPAFWLAVVGLSLNEAAYMAEIVRAGISSVGEGQYEAAKALGMTWSETMRQIVMPQAMRVIIPPTGNELISMLKTTSLVTAVPYSFELYSRTRDLSSETFNPIPMLLIACTWYMLFTSVLMVAQFYLERRYARGATRTMTARQLRILAAARLESSAGGGAR